ncbi:MAG: hypothetical protein AAB975_01205, partial [Patescibacteria group bacterium]
MHKKLPRCTSGEFLLFLDNSVLLWRVVDTFYRTPLFVVGINTVILKCLGRAARIINLWPVGPIINKGGHFKMTVLMPPEGS